MTPDCMSEGAVTMATEEETMTAAENGPREWATRMLAPGHAVILDTVICAHHCLAVLRPAHPSRRSAPKHRAARLA